MKSPLRSLIEHKAAKLLFLAAVGVMAACFSVLTPPILALFGVEPMKAKMIGARVADYFILGVLLTAVGIGFVIMVFAIARALMKPPGAVPRISPIPKLPGMRTGVEPPPIPPPVLEDPDKDKINRLFPQAMKIGDPFDVKDGPLKGSGRCIRRRLTPREGVLFTIRYSDGMIREWEWFAW